MAKKAGRRPAAPLDSDEAALMQVVGVIAQELASTDVQKFFSQGNSLNGTLRTVTPDRFAQTTVCRMNTQTARTNSRLETQRKMQLVRMMGEMKEKPDINPTSKKLVRFPQAPTTAPLYTRVSDIVLEKAEEKRRLQHQAMLESRRKENEECTFRPKTSQKGARTHDEFRAQALSWLSKRNDALERSAHEREAAELRKLQEKPQLSERSIKLAQRVNTRQRSREGSLTDRLYAGTPKKERPLEEPSFKPVLNATTLRLVRKQDRTPVHDRLYSLSGSRSSSAERRRAHTPTLDESLSRKYRINTSKGVAGREDPNQVHYSKDLEFLWRTLGNKRD